MAALTIILWVLLNLSHTLAEDYEEIQHIHGVENKISVLPDGSCKCQKELTKWDKLFVMLEDSQMKQNILQHTTDEVCKVELQSIRSEMRQFVANFAGTCTNAMDSATLHITTQMDKKLASTLEEISETNIEIESEQKNILQQLLLVSQDLSNRLKKLEMAWQMAVDMKDQKLSLGIKKRIPENLETTLNSLATELQQSKAELTRCQKWSAKHILPSGCDMALIFPMRSKKIFASVHPDDMTLSSFTACIWVKATDLLEKTIVFSYGTKRNPYQIQLYFNRSSAVLSVHSDTSKIVAENVVSLGQWTYFCATWSAEDGNATLWVNGKLAVASSGMAVGHNIPNGGLLQLGQESNGCCIGGGFDKNLAFSGKLTGFNIWDRVISKHEIQGLTGKDDSCNIRGNVVGWSVTEVLPHGGAEFIYY
ncbi:pentraxin-related protein PTX3-like isoform X1 [Carcharodon carcharias]|uniref:pentraxin-related protein PTX3-like isoform X1 n=1 Tax=Carcharodon carcharias TaxID=13397 RepID=UPI001B7DC1D6|nr:pentraxin-related protein PTX3-like isoform X1 [Carcharodon carcharias]